MASGKLIAVLSSVALDLYRSFVLKLAFKLCISHVYSVPEVKLEITRLYACSFQMEVPVT